MLDAASNTLNLILGQLPCCHLCGYDRAWTPLSKGATLLDASVADFNGDGFPDIAILGRAAW